MSHRYLGQVLTFGTIAQILRNLINCVKFQVFLPSTPKKAKLIIFSKELGFELGHNDVCFTLKLNVE